MILYNPALMNHYNIEYDTETAERLFIKIIDQHYIDAYDNIPFCTNAGSYTPG